MTKRRVDKKFFRPVHLHAVIFLLVYTIISKAIFIKSISSTSLQVAFFIPYTFGVFAGIFLLYLFSHEDFFHFMKDVEKEENKKEKKFLKKYKHYGKILSTFLIATIGGPVFAALTVRFLLNKFWYKYLLIALGNIPSTLLAVTLAKGILHFI